MEREEILQKVKDGDLTIEQATELMAKEDEAKRTGLYCKVSQKGALSVYGLQRMPVTLYVEQWERLLAIADEIRQFAKDHDSELTRKQR